MNVQKEIIRLNERELNLGIESVASSWHGDYKDSNFVFVGGLSFRLNEGDIKVLFSQWGTVIHVNLIRDKKSGKSKGYAFIGYEEQKSTILAVDNMNGTTIDGRQITVDHKKDYKIKEKEKEDEEQEEGEKKREREEEVVLDERALKRKKKAEKKEKKREMRREEKKKELMRMAFSQSTTITLNDLDVLEKVQTKYKNEYKEDEKRREMEKQKNLEMYKELMAAEPERKPNPKEDKKKAFTLPPEDPDKDNWKKKEIIPAWKYSYENGNWKRSDIHSYRYSWDNLNNMEDAKLKIPGPKEDKEKEKEKEKEKK